MIFIYFSEKYFTAMLQLKMTLINILKRFVALFELSALLSYYC